MIMLSFLPELDVGSLKNINLLFGCFFFAFTGSYLQELSNIYNGKQRVTKIHKIVVGTIFGMIIYLVLAARYIENIGITLSVAINVICGLLGYEIFNRCSTINGIKTFTSDLRDIVSNLLHIFDFIGELFKKDNDKDKRSDQDTDKKDDDDK